MSDNTWTWMSCSNTRDQQGIFGEKGKASDNNCPGARNEAVGWYDSSTEEFWLFGGFGLGSTPNPGACEWFNNFSSNKTHRIQR